MKNPRLTFAAMCLKLARDELKNHGREFMSPGEDVFDSAVQYGASIKLTKEEIIEASELEKKKKKKNK
jgi:hypothetical protein